LASNIVLSAAAWASALRVTIIEALVGALKEERGQGILEYAVLVGAIVIVFAGAIYAFGFDLDTTFLQTIQDCFDFDNTSCTD
jgi:Flp pilus assembly pilin Flp